MIPMTREELEKQPFIIRKDYDPESEQTCLGRGTGEIMECIV